MGAFLTFALDKENNLVNVNDVAKGIKCECHCPHCNAPLYAKNRGQVREHHFAHANGHECEGAYESSLHLLAKEVLQEAGCIMLPRNWRGFPSGLVRLRNIQVEKWDERYKIRPDVEGIMNNGERLLIEFYASHKVDPDKRKIIVDNKLKCIEIDINYQALDKKEFRDFLTGTDEDRKWLIELPPPMPKKESFSVSSPRKPIFDQTRNLLKEIFDAGTISISPGWRGIVYDLRKLGYDTCEVGAKYRGFKSDLLLYRSQKDDKGYISINIRGRRRSEIRKPKNLRVIDIVINPDLKLEYMEKHFKGGTLKNDYAVTIEYFDFQNK